MSLMDRNIESPSRPLKQQEHKFYLEQTQEISHICIVPIKKLPFKVSKRKRCGQCNCLKALRFKEKPIYVDTYQVKKEVEINSIKF